MDKLFEKSLQDIRVVIKFLEMNGICVIVVVVGIEVDFSKEKEILIDGDVIEIDNKKDFGLVGQKIVDKIVKGKFVLMLVWELIVLVI